MTRLDLPAPPAVDVLVGREDERRRLELALDTPAVRLIVIRGAMGAGKTALALEALARARDRGAFVGYGKHAEGAAGLSAEPLGTALGMLLAQALDEVRDPASALASLDQALGPAAPVLAALNIGLPNAIDTVAPLTGEAAAARLGATAIRFLRWMGGLGRPIILAFDDWGRADHANATLYEQLVRSLPDLPVTLIGVERVEEPAAVVADRTIDLAPLDRSALHALATGRLQGDAVTAAAVIALLDRSTTPLALLQSLAALSDQGALSRTASGWRLDRTAAVATLGGGVSDTLVGRVLAKSPATRRLLQAAALHGDATALEPLRRTCGLAPASFEAALAGLVDDGLLQVTEGHARFSHDSVRSAVLGSLPEPDRRSLTVVWADVLVTDPNLDGPGLVTALRLRLEGGLEGVEGVVWSERFLRGAAAARRLGAAGQAQAFAEVALQLPGAPHASFKAAREAGLAAIQAGDLTAGATFSRRMAELAREIDEHVDAAEAEVFVARLSGDHTAALAIGRAAVARLGLHVPPRGAPLAILAALARLKLTPDRRPAAAPRQSAAAYRLLNTVGAIAFERDPSIAVILAARSAAHGALRGTAFSAALRTVLACLSGDWRGASRWGDAAFKRLEADQPLRAPAMQLALQFGLGLTIDAARQMAESERLQAMALEEGDLGVAAYANRDRALASLRMPVTLAAHRMVLAECKEAAGRFQDQATAPLIDALEQMAINLQNGGLEPWRLRGEVFDSPRFEREAGPALERVATACMTFEVALANAFGAWETTLAVAERMGDRFDGLKHHPVAVIWAFNCGLARARAGQRIRPWERFVVTRAARFNPGSYAHRRLAFEAEAALRRRRTGEAMRLYEAAVTAGERSGFNIECGVVARAAAEAADSHGRAELAGRFRAAADAAWRRLGAWGLTTQPLQTSPTLDESRMDHAGAATVAERANRAKTRLLAGAAHELRTPIQGIQGLLDLAADDPDGLDMGRLRDAFSGLRAVVDDLTELGALEAERITLVEGPFSPLRLVETEADLARPEATRRERVIRITASGDADALAFGDASRIAQVVRNLLANALRYGDGEVMLDLRVADQQIAVTVADRGPGLSDADRTQLFQPFVRGDAASRAEGSGLGLALSRRIALRMDGTLEGDNRPGGGAVFRLVLPWRAAPTAIPADSASASLRILLAEDVELSRTTMTRLLARAGHEVAPAADGRAALAAAQAGQFDLLLLDVRMPLMDGPEVLRALRAAGDRTPAVMLSAAVDEPLARRLADLEPVSLVRKPLPATELLALVGATQPLSAAEALSAVLGDDEPAIRAQVRQALESRLEATQIAATAADLALAAEAAHAAAGLAAQFGMTAAEQAFAAMETAATAGDATALARSLAGGRTALAALA